MKKFAFPWSKSSDELRVLTIRFHDQICCILGLPCALCAGDIVIAEFIHALPSIDRVAVTSCNCICKIFLIPAAVAAVLRLAVNDVANDAVDLVWLLHQRRIAAACAEAGCDRWTDFARFPDSRVNAVIFINEWLMAFLAGAERAAYVLTQINALPALIIYTQNGWHTVSAWTALERWGDFLRVADGSSRRAGASGKRRGKCLLLHSRLCKDGRIIKRHRFLSAFRQANQASLYP